VRQSQGFNPKPLMKNTGALPLGLESRREMLVIEFTSALTDPADMTVRLTDCLPEGMSVLAIEAVSSAKVPRVESVLYRLEQGKTVNSVTGSSAFEEGLVRLRNQLVPHGLHRDKPLDAQAEIIESWIDDGDLFLRLRANESGATVSPYAVFGLVLAVDPEDLRSESLVKVDFALAGAVSGSGVGDPARMTHASSPRRIDSND
jgi:hypothetical protein